MLLRDSRGVCIFDVVPASKILNRHYSKQLITAMTPLLHIPIAGGHIVLYEIIADYCLSIEVSYDYDLRLQAAMKTLDDV